MKIPSAAFEGVNRLGFDTSPFIYFVERHPVYHSMMRDIIERIDGGILAGYASVITFAEVLVHPEREGKVALENEYRGNGEANPAMEVEAAGVKPKRAPDNGDYADWLSAEGG
jgi:predicted nucleic acid-binding protein